MAIGVEQQYDHYMKTSRKITVHVGYFLEAADMIRRTVAAADSLLEDIDNQGEAERLRLSTIEAGKTAHRALIDGLIQRLQSFKSDLI